MTHATMNNCDLGSDDYALLTEASTLGLKPGEWPETISTHLGNGRPFIRTYRNPNPDSYIYYQESGSLKLTVFND